MCLEVSQQLLLMQTWIRWRRPHTHTQTHFNQITSASCAPHVPRVGGLHFKSPAGLKGLHQGNSYSLNVFPTSGFQRRPPGAWHQLSGTKFLPGSKKMAVERVFLFIYLLHPPHTHARSGTGGHDGAGCNRCLSLTLVPPVRRPF